LNELLGPRTASLPKLTIAESPDNSRHFTVFVGQVKNTFWVEEELTVLYRDYRNRTKDLRYSWHSRRADRATEEYKFRKASPREAPRTFVITRGLRA
jgi:hypothetical protein